LINNISQKLRRQFALGLLVLLVLMLRSGVALAETDGPICEHLIGYLDPDGDGVPEAVVIACRFEPGGQDQVIVFDTENKMKPDIPWQSQVDFEDDTWVFDQGADNKADLIVVFHRDVAGELMADLYDDRDGDRQVSYQVENGCVKITENAHWTVRVIAPDGWWTRDGLVNFNLHILVDGDVEGMFGAETYRQYLATDGQVDFEIHVRDLDNDGRPDYDLRTQHIPWLQGAVGQGTQAMVNWADDEPPLRGGFALWPYLDLSRSQASGSRVVKDYRNSPPPLQFDPQTGRIEAVGEFVASRGGEHNCWYYSTRRWARGQVSEANSESPFCLYDLAEDHDGFPEMEVRAWYWLPHDPPFLGGKFSQPVEWIRYSWDQDNVRSWRYGLGLLGRHLIQSETVIGDFTVRTIPYTEFPAWVTEREWDMAVFAEVTSGIYWSSEGVYAVSSLEGSEFQDYLTGKSDQAPSGEINPERGFRFEQALNFNRRPLLYFSSVDRRLHLKGAQTGAWNIDDIHMVRYESLNGTGFINNWTFLNAGRPEKRLFVQDGFLIYADTKGVILRRSAVEPVLFETLPPRNHAEWLALGRLLETHQRDFAPGDFKAMMDQFEGPTMEISGAMLRDFRPTPNGFRFVLELRPGFRRSGEDWLGLAGKEPGAYVVSYAGTFHIQPLTPPSLRLAPADDPFAVELPTAYIPTETRFHLSNTGLEDASSVAVTATFTSPSGAMEQVVTQTVSVLAGETVPLRFVWTPTSAGHWRIQVVAQTAEEEACPSCLATTDWKVKVTPPEEERIWDMVSAWGLVPPWAVLLLLGATATTGGLAGIVILHLLESEAQQHRESEQV
jgi:hypothetical protein